jgi:hypothetical protein
MPKGHTNNPSGRKARTPEQMRDFLISKRRLNGYCWEWTGAFNQWGYGQLTWAGWHTMVHRVAAVVWMGLTPRSPLRVCHSCDNPKCFNPEHLWFGTDEDNARDCADKKRHFRQRKTHCKNGHEFTKENTAYKLPKGSYGPERRCKICHRASMKIIYDKNHLAH